MAQGRRQDVRTATPDDLLDTDGVAEALGVAKATVLKYKARFAGDEHNPWPEPFVLVGGHEAYHRADIDAWNARRRPMGRPAAGG